MANLRDKGYPSAKDYKPNKSNKRTLPMTDNVERSKVNALQTETIPVKSKGEEALDKLITAYNNRAFANPSAPLVQKMDNTFTDGSTQSGLNVMKRGSQDLSGRLGFAYKYNRPGEVSYDIGLDNGRANRGVFDAQLSTPYGRFGGGFEDETNYLSASSPNEQRGLNLFYATDDIEPIEANIGRGTSDVTGGNMYYADTNYPFTEDRYKSFNTPLGELSMFTSAKSPFNEGYGSIDFTPNQYAQALANLLRGQF